MHKRAQSFCFVKVMKLVVVVVFFFGGGLFSMVFTCLKLTLNCRVLLFTT